MTAFIVQAFLTLLVVMDPVGLAPSFVALAGTRTELERSRIAKKASIIAAIIVLGFALVGALLLENLGISLAAFRASGGVLLFLIALDMVFARQSGAKENKDEEAEAQTRQDISVFPLAIPFMAGPGTLASVMILEGQAKHFAYGAVAIIVVAFVVLVICYFSLRSASYLVKLIGLTGVHVVTRVLGMLLAALAVQYIADGARELLNL